LGGPDLHLAAVAICHTLIASSRNWRKPLIDEVFAEIKLNEQEEKQLRHVVHEIEGLVAAVWESGYITSDVEAYLERYSQGAQRARYDELVRSET
jgi:hypothetical protein